MDRSELEEKSKLCRSKGILQCFTADAFPIMLFTHDTNAKAQRYRGAGKRSEQKVAALHEVLKAKMEIGTVRPREWPFGKNQHAPARRSDVYCESPLHLISSPCAVTDLFKGVDLGGGTVTGCRDLRGKTEEFGWLILKMIIKSITEGEQVANISVLSEAGD